MKISANKDDNNLIMMVSGIKIAIIVFIGMIIYMNLPRYWMEFGIKDNGQFNLYTAEFLSLIMGGSFITCLMANRKIFQLSKHVKYSWLIENIFFIGAISIPLYLFTVYQNECKYLFILLIISSVIQYGSYYGIITSMLSSVVILVLDLVCIPLENGVNIYFQKDIIMAVIFIFIASVLGYYVDIEAKKNKKKDEALNMLSTELEEKDKQREEMESLLLSNKICYDMLFENSLNAIILHNSGKIIYANASATKLLGYENPINLNGETFYKHYPEDLLLGSKEKYSEISSNKLSKVIYEENIFNCNGELIPVRNTSSFFTYKGEASVLTFLLDISSEKKVETLERDVAKNLKLLNETREFNNLITDFFTNMSHELKTPVNVIYAAVQTISIYLDDYRLDSIAKSKSYLKTMKQNCLRMIRLINNLLDITKLDSGFIKLNKKNGDIVGVVEDIVLSVASYIKSKDIELIFDTDVEEKIIGFDHDMMERIMLNLVSNALKYSHPEGHIYVNVIDKGSSVIIKVKDEGDGIPEDKINVIFERFGQVNSSLSRQCEGTGIGLYLVKSFIEMHSGKISVISAEGKGSEFTIELPEGLVKGEEYENKVLFETHVERIETEFSDIYSI